MKPLSFTSVEAPVTRSEVERLQPAKEAEGESFGATLKTAIAQVDAMQNQADLEAQKLGNGEGNLHETMLALEKADVAMKVAMKVRNKVLDAYNEVMRMPV